MSNIHLFEEVPDTTTEPVFGVLQPIGLVGQARRLRDATCNRSWRADIDNALYLYTHSPDRHVRQSCKARLKNIIRAGLGV